MRGWECPKCGKVYAWWVKECETCGKVFIQETTYIPDDNGDDLEASKTT